MRANVTPVEVRSSFLQDHWAPGFDVVEIVRRRDRELYRLRRRSDGALLPELFDTDRVRQAGRA